MKRLLIPLLMLSCMLTTRAQECCCADTAAIRASITALLGLYPQAHLLDIYKSQFQDRFGPGHIVADREAARRYFDRELAETDTFGGPLIEPCGYRGDYIRVNMVVVADSIVPYYTMLNSFIDSANSVNPPSIEQWRREWASILGVIRAMGLDATLADFDAELEIIESRLAEGKYDGHHSRAFEQLYHPHYRIVHRDIFDRRLRNLIEDAE